MIRFYSRHQKIWGKIWGVLLLFGLTWAAAQAQVTTIRLDATTNGSTNSGCSYNFYDSGGAGANYSNSQNYTITFCASGSEVVRIDFRSFVLGASDTLFLYNGSSTSAPLIGSYRATTPGVKYSTGTCLTVQFKSDAATTAQGWYATVSCMKPYSCSSNLLTNGTFDSNFSDWTATNGSLANQTRYLMDGGPQIVWLQWTSDTATITQTVTSGIMQGQTYWLRGYLGTHEIAYDHTFGLEFYNSSNVLLASSFQDVNHDVDPLNNLGYYEIYLAAPTGASYAIVKGTATGDYLKIDGLCLSSTMTPPATCDTICHNQTAKTFSIAAVSGATGYTWFVDGSSTSSAIVSGQGTTAVVLNLTLLSDGAHTICVTAEGADGCSSAPSCVCIFLPSIPTVSATGGAFCEGATINLTSTPSGGIAPYTYSWTGPGGFTSTAQNPTRTNATAAMAGTYNLTITDADGCTATAAATVTISTIPSVTLSNTTICVGGTATLTATYTGGSGTVSTFQWQSSPDNSAWSNESGGTATSFTTPALSANTYYRVTVTMSTACTAVSASGLVTVVADPSISTQPSNATICVGGSQNFTVVAAGGVSLTYQWQYNNSGTWGNVTNGTPANASFSGGTTATLGVSGSIAAGTYQFRVLVNDATSGCNSVTSSTATLTINADPSISTQPSNATICVGGSQNFSVVAAGGASLTYQWQYNNSGTWGNVTDGTPANSTFSGGTTATLGVSGNIAAGTYQFRVLVNDATSGCNSVTSSTATLTINADPSISTQPSNATICVGGSQNFTVVAAGGASLTYQWQYNNSGTWGNVTNGTPTNASFSGGTTATLGVSGNIAAGTYQFRVLVNDATSGCNSVTSSTATLTVNADPSISTQPSNATICVGGSQNFTVVAAGGVSLTYQWQYNNSGTWGNVANGTPANSTFSGGTTATLGVSGSIAAGTYQFRVLVNDATSGCNSVTSSTATLTINADPSISTQPSNATICVGGSQNFSVVAAGGASLTYQWQYNNSGTWGNVTNGTPANSTFSGGTTATLGVSGNIAAGTYQFRVLVNDATSGCNSVTSSTATLTINADPSISSQPSNATICVGGSQNFSATVTGGASLVYQWQYFNGTTWNSVANGTPTNASYSGATTATMTVSGNIAAGTYQYRLAVTDASSGCDGIFSNAATLTIVDDPSISVQPSSAAICIGSSANFSVTASGGAPSLTYQWQYFNGTSWGNVAGGAPTGAVYTNQTTATLTVSGISAAGSYDYRVLVSASGNDCGTVTSSTATLTVSAGQSISTSGATTICAGGNATLTASTGGGSGTCTIQWQWSPNGSSGWTNLAGANSASYTTGALTTTTYYRALYTCTGGGCGTVVSNNQTVTVVADPTASIVGANISICPGGSATLTASITGGGTGTASYQWQDSPDNTTWTNISGATNTTLNTGALTATRYYRVIISFTGNGCNDAISATGSLTVIPDPTVTVTGAGTICTGGTDTLAATTSGGTGTCTLQWQRLVGAVWTNISGATATTYITPALTVTTSYRASYSCNGSGCTPAFSDPVTVTVVADPNITAEPSGGTICIGGAWTLSVSVTGGIEPLTYQWQYLNGASWENISAGTPTGATYLNGSTANLTVSGISAAGTFQYRVLVGSGGVDCGTDASTAASIVVVPDPTISISGGGVFCESGTSTLTATTSGGTGGCTIQWQQSDNGIDFANISGATGSTYTPPVLSATTWFRAVLVCGGSECGTGISDSEIIEITPSPVISIGIKGN